MEVLYDVGVDTKAALPDEAPDLTGSELHHRLLSRLEYVLQLIFGDRALVLSEVFVRVRGGDDGDLQAGPDIAVIPGARPGNRTVYWVPDEPVPAVTIEVLSPANHRSDGAKVLAEKRALFGRIGVPIHVEIDPDRGQVITWTHDGTELVEGEPARTCHHPGLGGLRIETTPNEVRLFLPGGREVIDAMAETERLGRALRQAGIDPTTV